MAEHEPVAETEVLIVGLGPVGATLALLLARLGRHVTVIERQATPYGFPRAVHIDDGAARVLQAAGLGELLAANSQQTSVYEWRNAEGTTLLRLSGDRKSLNGWPSSNMIHQPTIEAGMAELVDSTSRITVHRDETVTRVAHHETGATVTSLSRTGTTKQRTASYVVGCDGANSIVRAQMGVPTVDLGFFFDWLIVDVILNEARKFDPENLQVCDPLRPTTVVSGGPGRRRWEFMCLPHENPTAMNHETVAWQLLEPWDLRPENATLERHAVYRFQAMWVQKWRTGKLLLAGDAAHLMPPFAGQGLCSGLKDAANLAWKLDHVLTNPADEQLLDSYEEERTPHVKGAIELSVELGKIICVPDPEAANVRDEAMAPQAAHGRSVPPSPAPTMAHGFIATGMLLAGRTFPQGMLSRLASTPSRPSTPSTPSTSSRSDDASKPGWKLVGVAGLRSHLLGLGGSDSSVDWFTSFGDVIEIGTDLSFTDQVVTDWVTEHRTSVVLVRPDQIVFGAVADPRELGSLLQLLRTSFADLRPLSEEP